MNERIKQLATETDIWCDQNFHNSPEYNIQWEQKFAELIVRECADIATINAHQWASPGTYVLKHFGVEE